MQCILVKEGQRCTNVAGDFMTQGVQLPIVKPDAIGYICGDCIYNLYQAITARDLVPNKVASADQVRKEMGLA
jgi:hypothetical protein